MRPRKQDRHLPACLYLKHGSYWLVKKGKWTNLGKDYSEALQEYARLQAQPTQKKNGMPELIDNVLAVHLKGKAKSTRNGYTRLAERLKTILAEFEPAQVKPKHIAAIKTSLAAIPSQANTSLSLLRVIFNYALEWGLVESNPCIGIRRHKEHPRTRYITHDEFNALLNHLSEPMQNLFTLVYLTGQRIGDVLRLKQSDISEAGIRFTQQKTGAKLLITLTPDISEVLASLKPNAQGHLFCLKHGRAMSYKAAWEAYNQARKAADVQGVTIHDLRAKSLTDADDEGKNAQKLGGHKSAGTTRIYLRSRKITQANAPTLPKKTPEY